MKSLPIKTTLGILALVGLFSACGKNQDVTTAEWTPDPTDGHAYVTTLGTDTVTVELFTRDTESIRGVLVERTPVTRVTRYTADLDDDGRITHFNAEQVTPATNPEGPGVREWNVRIGDGLAVVERTAGENPGTTEIEVTGAAIPTLGRTSSAMYVFEEVNRQLLGSETTPVIELVGPTSARASVNNARIISADSISMDFFGDPRIAWLGEDQQILGATGAVTTLKAETRRVSSLDTDALAARWGAMDARGEGIGTPSIPGNVSATVGAGNFEVVYSRPAKRGRVIWGGLVDYGKVWRTGANAATQFTTDRDLMVGTAHVPAGTYTLWSIFTEADQHLIINRQTGQWGTQYDEAQDLARIPFTKTTLDEPVERFTISIADTDAGGEIRFDWDTTRFAVAFMVH